MLFAAAAEAAFNGEEQTQTSPENGPQTTRSRTIEICGLEQSRVFEARGQDKCATSWDATVALEALLRAAARHSSTSEQGMAFLLEQGQQLVDVLGTRAEVHRINPKPRLPFQFRGREPKFPAFLDAPRNLGM